MSDLLNQYRAASPELADLTDDELIKAVHLASGDKGSPYDYARSVLGYQDKGSRLKDFGIDVARSVGALGEIATGAIDLATGGYGSRAWRESGRQDPVQEFKGKMARGYSTKRNEAQYNVDAAEGFFGKLGAMAENPSVPIGMMVEQAPSLAIPFGAASKAGTLAAKGAMKFGPQTPKALRFADELGRTAGETAGWTGVTMGQTAAQMQQIAPGDDQAMYDAAGLSGGVTAGITAGFSFLPGGQMVKQAISAPKRYAAATANVMGQSAGESTAQQGAINYATGQPLEQGLGEAAAMGIAIGTPMGALAGRKRPDFAGPPPAPPTGSRAPFTTQELERTWQRPAVQIMGDETLTVSPQGEVMNPQQFDAYQQFQQASHPDIAEAAQPVQPPAQEQQQVQDPAGQALAQVQAQKQGKPAKVEEPPPAPEELDALFAKIGAPEMVPARRPDGSTIMNDDGKPLMVRHWDGSDKQKVPAPYTSPEKMKKAVEKAIKAEREKPQGIRAAEASMATAIRGELGRYPTSKELASLVKETELDGIGDAGQEFSPTRLVHQIDIALRKMEGKKSPDAEFKRDALAIWKKAVEKELKDAPKVEKADTPKAEAKKAPAETAALITEPPVDVLAAVADRVTAPDTITIRNHNGKAEVMTPQSYMDKVRNASPQDAMRFMRLTGMDQNGDVVNAPMTHAQIAKLEGKKPSAISNWAKDWGLTKEVVDKLASTEVKEISKAEEAGFMDNTDESVNSGMQVYNNAGELKKAGLLGNERTAAQKRADAEANRFLKENASKEAPEVLTREEIETAEAIDAKKKAQAEIDKLKDQQRALESAYRQEAIREYNAMRSKKMGEKRFEELDEDTQTEWVLLYDYNERADVAGKADDVADLFDEFKKENYDRLVRTGEPSTGGPRTEALGGPRTEADVQPRPDQDGDAGAAEVRAPESPGGAPRVVTKRKREYVKPAGAVERVEDGARYASKADLENELLDFLGVESLGENIRIVDANDLTDADRAVVEAQPRWQAWAQPGLGKVVLRADRIYVGHGRAVFLHEVGSHMGIEQILTPQQRGEMVDQINRWAKYDKGDAGTIAKAALARMEDAEAESSPARRSVETLAYFIEEATLHGVKPSVHGHPVARMIKRIMAFFQNALNKLVGGKVRDLTPQDVVNMAYGAAQMNVQGGDAKIPFSAENTEGIYAGSAVPVGSMPSPVQQRRTIESNINKLPAKLRRPARGITAAVHDVVSRGVKASSFMHDLADGAVKVGLTSAKKIADYSAIKGALKIKLDQDLGKIVKQLQDLPKDSQMRAQRFLLDSTMDQTWGYQPDWRPKVDVDPAAEAKYLLLPEDAKIVVDDMLKHGWEVWKAKQDAIRDLAHTHYTEMVAEAEARGADRTEIDKIWAEMDKMVNKTAGLLKGPYVPTKRTGSHVVSMKSQELLDAIANKDPKVEEMSMDPKHYIVEFYDGAYKAANREAEMREEFSGLVEMSRREEHEYLGAGYEVLQALSERVKSRLGGEGYTGVDKDVAAATYRALQEAIIESLGEFNVRSSALQRKNIAGMNPMEIGRSFAAQGYADNRFLAGVKHNKEINDAMSEMRVQLKNGGNRTVKQDFYNEFQKRRANALNVQMPAWAGHAMRFTTLWKLVTSPAYYLQYLTQPVTMFLPAIQGKHGYGKSVSAFIEGIKTVTKMHQGLDELDFSKVEDADERAMLQTLRDNGTIQIGHEQMFGRIEMAPENGFSKVWQTVSDQVARIPHTVEAHNRAASALAAYRMERKAGSSHEDAIKYVKETILQTYGDYSSFNAPRIFQGGALTRMAMQYRQFQFIHTALLSRVVKNAFGGADAETKKAARLQLGYMAGHYGVLAGALGVPAAHVVGHALRMALGDEQDKDLETFVKRHVKDQTAQDMILGGVPRALLGQDLASRIGAGDILDPMRYGSIGGALSGKEGYKDFMTAAMGPFFGGLIPQVIDGVNTVGDGDIYRGLEKLTPKGISDVMKAFRIADEGLVDNKGAEVATADEVGMGDIIAKGLGSTPVDISGPSHDSYVASQVVREFKDQSNKLKSQFIRAKRDGEDVTEIVEDFKALMARQKAAGIKPQTLSDLYKAPSQMRSRERRTVNGVQFRPGTEELVRDITGAKDTDNEE